MRLRWATAAPCLPRAVLVAAGRCAIVFWPAAVFWAFFTLRLAAWVCFLVTMASSFVVNWPSGHALPRQAAG